MEPRRAKPEQRVAGLDLASVHDLVSLYDANDGAGQVVIAGLVKVRHLGRLAADERAAVLTAAGGEALHDRLEHVGLERAGGEVVEKEERARAGDGDVVDAVVHQVVPHGVVPADALRHF